ncbi:MAG: iron-containing alcohol dehydrogenase [Oscillospiraceae bacterium]
MNKLICRVYQTVLRVASYAVKWPIPEVRRGENSILCIGEIVKKHRAFPILIVTDKGIAATEILSKVIEALGQSNIPYAVYDETVVNPTIANVENALVSYYEKGCKGILALGGGSALDCAKALAARAANPRKSISQMRGQLKVRKKPPLLIAVPTTAGTGSEATIAAVITDPDTHEKYAINDMVLVPQYAILDPMFTLGMPSKITSTTGVDALTHAVEAYIGKSNTRRTKKLSEQACKLVFDNLYLAYSDGQSIQARENMQTAAFFAGCAFTRAYVGYIHAIAHALGGMYGIPHGLANAIILPHVLEYYGKSVYKPLAKLADVVGVTESGDTDRQKSEKFIAAIRAMNKSMDIPEKITGINKNDLPIIIKRALKEANPLYPVPKILDEKDLYDIFKMLMD